MSVQRFPVSMWFDAFQIKRRAIASNKRKEERAAA